MADCCIFKALLIVSFGAAVWGHGMLFDPPSRNSAWRFGFDTPVQWTDNELNCGGRAVQWNTNNGKCGVCGDRYDAKSPKYVHPGQYATDTITKTYTRGQIITTTVKITANHLGHFQFRVGKLVNKPITQAQLTHVLEIANSGGKTKWDLPSGNQEFQVDLKLPDDLTCDHCVFQWWYTAGNTWNSSKQESFVNCADIKITQ